MMWAIHVQMGVTPRNLVASMFALNVRESRHIAITSSMIQQVCMCVRMYSYVKQQTCIGAPETRARPKTDPQEVHWVEHNSNVVRTHASQISSNIIEVLVISMPDDIYAK